MTDAFSAPPRIGSRDDAEAWIRAYLADHFGIPPETVNFDLSLSTHGLDSFDLIVLAEVAEQRFGIEIDPALAFQCPTVAAFLDSVMELAR